MRTVLMLGIATGCASVDVSEVEQASTLVQTLQGYNTQIDGRDLFGEHIALSRDGSALAVGSVGESSCATGVNGPPSFNCAPASGAAYVFRNSGGSWVQEGFFKASNNRTGTGLGSSIAISADGSTLAAAAATESSASTGINGDQTQGDAPEAGAVYVFARTPRGWSQQAYIKASNTNWGDAFGYTIALSGDGSTLIVGAIREDSSATGIGGDQSDNSAVDSGAVYVFARTGQRWTQAAYVKAPVVSMNGQFGSSLTISDDGTTFAVGTVNDVVYIFSLDRRTWRQSAALTPSPSLSNGVGSHSMAMTGDAAFLVAGAPGEASGTGDPFDTSAPYAGAVYVFANNGGQWTQQAYVKASNPDTLDELGFSVAASSTTILAGAIGESSGTGDPLDNSAPTSGAAYLFTDLVAPTQTEYLKSPTIAQFTQYGRSVAMSAGGSVFAVSQPYLAGGFVYVYAP